MQIPAMIYPTRYRCTSHGISAAFGKIGSIIAQYLLNSYDNSNGRGHGSAEWIGYALLMYVKCLLSLLCDCEG
jgi:MFS transporter, PHS family, inorganic phosphate transporter